MDLDNFITGKTQERRTKGRVGKKNSNCCHMVGKKKTQDEELRE
jgi:hypothetical protein